MAHALYEIDVRLRNITPPIWRTIELAGASTLEDLHYAIQSAMGWTNSHLHQFTIGKTSYGMVDVDEGPGLEDERRVRLHDVARSGDAFVYEYDFGDDWEHDITIKRVTTVAKAPRPRCTGGERACPPEDCGGPGGYEQLLEVLANPSHPEHASMIEWADGFEPESFELAKSGRDLRREMDQLKLLAEGGGELDDAAFGVPKLLVEAALALDPMQRASLAALIVGSLGEELVEARAAAAKRQHRPARGHRRSAR